MARIMQCNTRKKPNNERNMMKIAT